MFEHLFLSLNFSYFLAKFPPLHDLNASYILTGRPVASMLPVNEVRSKIRIEKTFKKPQIWTKIENVFLGEPSFDVLCSLVTI